MLSCCAALLAAGAYLRGLLPSGDDTGWITYALAGALFLLLLPPTALLKKLSSPPVRLTLEPDRLVIERGDQRLALPRAGFRLDDRRGREGLDESDSPRRCHVLTLTAGDRVVRVRFFGDALDEAAAFAEAVRAWQQAGGR